MARSPPSRMSRATCPWAVNGWVSTPGGRLWFVDGRSGALRQICGRGCLPVDPGFVPEEHGPVPDALSLDGLYARFGRSR